MCEVSPFTTELANLAASVTALLIMPAFFAAITILGDALAVSGPGDFGLGLVPIA